MTPKQIKEQEVEECNQRQVAESMAYNASKRRQSEFSAEYFGTEVGGIVKSGMVV